MDQIEGFRLYLSVAEEDRLQFSREPTRTPELFGYSSAGDGHLTTAAFAGAVGGALAGAISSSATAPGSSGGGSSGGGGGGGGGGW